MSHLTQAVVQVGRLSVHLPWCAFPSRDVDDADVLLGSLGLHPLALGDVATIVAEVDGAGAPVGQHSLQRC